MNVITIPTTNGDMEVPVHNEDNCKNLCVTMASFGVFEITHISSGRKLFGDFERAASATAEALKIEKCLIDLGIDKAMSMEEFQAAIKSQTEKSQDLCDMTPLEYIKFCSNISGFAGEFPWESYEDSPFCLIEKLRLDLSGKQ